MTGKGKALAGDTPAPYAARGRRKEVRKPGETAGTHDCIIEQQGLYYYYSNETVPGEMMAV